MSAAAVPADYTGNGNVTKLGQIDPQPPNPYYGDNSSTGQLYNGMWGYAAGLREYALQSNSFGLHIIDVTDPAAPFRVQFIDMSGGVSPPKGRIWRDADIHYDAASGKTYAYVGAQSNGNLWIVDLSYLSDSAPQGVDSNPIPPAGIADRGRTNYGHTVFVNDGLLFMNTANNASTLGCQIFDLLQNPFDPPIIASWSGSGARLPRQRRPEQRAGIGRQKTCSTRRKGTRPGTGSSTSPTSARAGRPRCWEKRRR